MNKKLTIISNLDPNSQRELRKRVKKELKSMEVDVLLPKDARHLIKEIPNVIRNVYLKYPIKEMLDPEWIRASLERGEQGIVIASLNGDVVGSGSLIYGRMNGGELYELGRTAVHPATQGMGFGKALVIARIEMARFLYSLLKKPAFIFSEPRAINTRTVHNVIKYGGLSIVGIAPLYDVNESKESVLQMVKSLGKKAVLPIVNERLNQMLRKYVDDFKYKEYEKGLPNKKGRVFLIGGRVLKEGEGDIGSWYSHEGASLIKITLQQTTIHFLEQIISQAFEIANKEKLGTIAIAAFTTRGFDELIRYMKERGFVVSAYYPSFEDKPGVLFTTLNKRHAKPLGELYLPGEIPDEFENLLKEIHQQHIKT